MNVLPILLCDAYKCSHFAQYEPDTTLIYSNLTPRKSRIPELDGVIAFGFQYFIEEYLIRQFDDNFFSLPKEKVMEQYKRRINNYFGPDAITFDHITALHDLKYLPLHIKAVPEGTLVPFRVPVFTIYNTKPEFFWLTNALETLLSNVLWGPITSATTSFNYRRVFDYYANKTGSPLDFVQWQGHDFSMRGMFGIEAACTSGAAHLLSFTGSDTIPAVDFLEEYYGGNCEKELVASSVSATEHSVMSMGSKDGELETIRRLITKVYPKGIISIVCDTWDFWKVITEYLPILKDEIMARDGVVTCRPDSGTPEKIICGDPESDIECVRKGAIECLWDIFGGTITSTGHKQLDSHINLIYGDSITPARQKEILSRLDAKGFCSKIVLGIGSYTFQHVTRDTLGMAMKATYGETKSRGPQNIHKDPKTDDGTKKSATGLLKVFKNDKGILEVKERCTWEEEGEGILQTIFKDGKSYNFQTLAEIRQRIQDQL